MKKPTKPVLDEAAIMVMAVPCQDGSVDFNIDLGYNLEGFSAMYAKAVIELVTSNRGEMEKLLSKYVQGGDSATEGIVPKDYLLN